MLKSLWYEKSEQYLKDTEVLKINIRVVLSHNEAQVDWLMSDLDTRPLTIHVQVHPNAEVVNESCKTDSHKHSSLYRWNLTLQDLIDYYFCQHVIQRPTAW